MASPKELVGVVADVTGLPDGTIIQHDRNLSLAGLRSVGGRGRAVAQVTAQDAAHLLIAIIAAHSVKDSARAVQRHGQMRLAGTWDLAFLPIPELIALPAGHTLVEAVTALIEAGITGSLQAAVAQACGEDQDLANDLNAGVEIKVIALNPAPTSKILIRLVETDQVEERSYDKPRVGRGLSNAYNATPEEILADLRGQFHIGHRSIMRVAELLRRDASD